MRSSADPFFRVGLNKTASISWSHMCFTQPYMTRMTEKKLHEGRISLPGMAFFPTLGKGCGGYQLVFGTGDEPCEGWASQ
jgi:hypothetical protein